jgi:hypothetical protein
MTLREIVRTGRDHRRARASTGADAAGRRPAVAPRREIGARARESPALVKRRTGIHIPGLDS